MVMITDQLQNKLHVLDFIVIWSGSWLTYFVLTINNDLSVLQHVQLVWRTDRQNSDSNGGI